MFLSSEQQHQHRTELPLLQERVHHSTLGFLALPHLGGSDKAQACSEGRAGRGCQSQLGMNGDLGLTKLLKGSI